MPRYDVQKLLELYTQTSEETGSKVERSETTWVEPTPAESV